MSGEIAIRTEDLGKRYYLGESIDLTSNFREALMALPRAVVRRMRQAATGQRRRNELWALRDVNLEIRRGEAVALIGRNGAGKSTLLKVMSRITWPTTGRVSVKGRVGSLLEVGTGFHPELTGRENIYLNGAILGMRKAEIDRKFDEIVEFSGVGQFLDTPVKRYSSGMRVRLGFAVAAHLDLENLIVDEVLAVGDREFQRKCLQRMRDLADANRTVLFVSHNLGLVRHLCTRGVLMASGRIVMDGPIEEVIDAYVSQATEQTAGEIDLTVHPNRRGRGEPFFRRLSILVDGEPVNRTTMGGAMTLQLEYEWPEKPNGLRIDITIHDSIGQPIVLLSTAHQCPERLTDAPGSGVVTCHLPWINLVDGHYRLAVAAHDNAGVLDAIEDAGELQIEPHDVYGTGSFPTRHDGAVFVDAQWDMSWDAAAHPDAPRPMNSRGAS